MMETNDSSKQHHIFAALLGISGLLILLIFITLRSQTDDSSTTTTISNANPSVDSVTIALTSGGTAASEIDLSDGTTKVVYAHGAFTDNNGCDEVDDGASTGNIALKLYRSGATNGADCTTDNNDCYPADLNSASSCTITGCAGGTDITASYECSVNVTHFADPTDASAPYSAQNWVAQITATDENSATGNNTATTEVNSLAALSLSGTIDYGSLALGATSDSDTIDIYNDGNRLIDVDVIGTDMTCGTGVIEAGNQRFSASELAYGSMVSLSSSLAYTTGIAGTVDGDEGRVPGTSYWKILIPSSGVAGSCTGTNTFTATAV